VKGAELAVLKGHEQRVHFADLSPDRQRAVTASADGTVRLWRVAQAREHALLLQGHTGPVGMIRFSPDGSRVLTAADTKARIWDAVSGESVTVLKPVLHPEVVQAINKYATRSAEETDYRNTPFSQEQIARYRAERIAHMRARMESEILGGLTQAEFSPDGRSVVTVSRDAPVVLEAKGAGPGSQRASEELPHVPVRIFEATTGAQLVALKVEKNPSPNPKHPWAGQRNHVLSAVFSPDGRRVLLVEGDSFSRYTLDTLGGGTWSIGRHDQPTAVRIYEVASGKEILAFRLQGPIRALFSPDGQRVLTASNLVPDLDAKIKEIAGQPLPPIPLSVTAGKSICLWDARTGKRLAKLDLVNWENPVLLFSRDGPRVLALKDKTARLWDVAAGSAGADKPPSLEEIGRLRDGATWKELVTFQGRKKFLSAAFSADGRRVAIVNEENTAGIWDTTTSQQRAVLQGHQRKINAVAFSPDSQLVVTASDDETARLWYADTGQELYTLTGHRMAVTLATFSPDGKRVATASMDGTARVWLIDPLEIAVRRKPRELTPEERQAYEINLPGKP
jgi:WD40 repeat protein